MIYFCTENLHFPIIMYENYLKFTNIPSGAILKRILLKNRLSQKDLAKLTGILPQRINDYITQKRRFTVKSSFKIEQALDIKIRGFFYLIQCQHDIFLAQQQDSTKTSPFIENFRKNIFWDIDINKIDWDINKATIIQRIFEYGNKHEINEIIQYYGKDIVIKTLNNISDKWKYEERTENIRKYLL